MKEGTAEADKQPEVAGQVTSAAAASSQDAIDVQAKEKS
jgi:hypothetical protein